MVNSTFVTDTADSLDSWINEGAQKLHDFLVSAYGDDYVEKSAVLTTVAGQTDYTLPADFYKLLGLELPFSGSMKTLKRYNRTERNAFANQPVALSRFNIPRYKLSKGVVRLLPAPSGVLVGKIWYSPLLQVTKADTSIINLLVDPTDTIDFPAGWERYVVKYASRVCMSKEESNTSEIADQIKEEEEKLMVMIENRNADMPQQAVDLDSVDYEPEEF